MDKTSLFISNSKLKDVRRIFIKFLLFTPLLLVVVAINLHFDPAGLYKKMIGKNEIDEYHIAQKLAARENVKVIDPINDRLLEKYFIEDLTMAPDVVVLGSSHATWIGDNIFLNRKVVNNTVTTAVLADYLGIFEGYAKRNLYPKNVVLSLEPQLINFPVSSEKWLSIKEDTLSMLDRLGNRSRRIKQPIIQQAWLNIFSITYFQESIRKLWNRHKTISEDGPDTQLFLNDGRRLWGLQLRKTEKSRKKILEDLMEGKNEQILKQSKPDEELKNILEDFIRYLTEHHIRVTLCMFPVHPQVYKTLLDLQKKQGTVGITDIEHYYRSLSQKLKLDLIGSFDPAACGLEGKDFDDGDHIKIDVIEKMLKQKGSRCSMPGL